MSQITRWPLAPAMAAALWLAVGLAQPARAGAVPLPPEAARVGRDFLAAFCRNDRDAIQGMIPKDLSNLYGPSPFDRMPSLSKPRADERVAAVDFEGKMTDPGLPKKGTIILRYVAEGGTEAWRVRQIYWYDELPPEAGIPEKSRTEADRMQEPGVRQAAKEFIHYWLASDYQEMDRRVFHWWTTDRRPPKWVRMTRTDVEGRPTTLGGIRVDFVAKLWLAKVVPKRVSGMFWMVPEEGAWRVRPLTFAFFF